MRNQEFKFDEGYHYWSSILKSRFNSGRNPQIEDLIDELKLFEYTLDLEPEQEIILEGQIIVYHIPVSRILEYKGAKKKNIKNCERAQNHWFNSLKYLYLNTEASPKNSRVIEANQKKRWVQAQYYIRQTETIYRILSCLSQWNQSPELTQILHQMYQIAASRKNLKKKIFSEQFPQTTAAQRFKNSKLATQFINQEDNQKKAHLNEIINK